MQDPGPMQIALPYFTEDYNNDLFGHTILKKSSYIDVVIAAPLLLRQKNI